jgi:hypothetical protein
MQGLTLARRYYEAFKEALLAPYAGFRSRIAAGLVGYGSECFGFDDTYSTDHDFGPGFCLWLTDADYAAIGASLQADYDRLPQTFEGYPPRSSNTRSGKRVGVFPISGFYSEFLGAPELPISDADWLQIPEELLASAVNGEVFDDPLGAFSRIRTDLAGYYPAQVKRLKLATYVARMAQSGQYNLVRTLRRQETTTAILVLAEFIRNTCNTVYALNNRYTPVYKWLHRGVRDLPILSEIHVSLTHLGQLPLSANRTLIEDICAAVLAELVAQGYTQPGDSFLECHVDAILGQKQDIES